MHHEGEKVMNGESIQLDTNKPDKRVALETPVAAITTDSDPFLFERVTVDPPESQDELLARAPGWCACRGRCNCFCGNCAACSIYRES